MTTKKIITMISAGLLTGWFTTSAQSGNNSQKTTVPVRISVVPGLSTQGKADKYTTSKFSLNIYGGVTGSVDGVEVGSLFNIDKMNVQYVQAAGLFNMVNGSVKGVQAAGLFNTAGSRLQGVQAAGISNYTKGNVTGIQAGGIYNHAGNQLKGIQVAGISNYTQQNLKGIQVAGISNISSKGTAGIQVSGILNYTRNLKGLQVGLINIADTSSGFSIGLLNIVVKGYHKLSVYTNEVLNMNVAYKSGNPKLYNILLAGINTGSTNKVFSYGYGLGHEIAIGKRLTINPEITSQYVYLGNWHYFNLLSKVHLSVNIKLANNIAIFAAPSFTAYYSDQVNAVHGYKFKLPSNSYSTFDLWNNNVKGWIGWSAGLTFF